MIEFNISMQHRLEGLLIMSFFSSIFVLSLFLVICYANQQPYNTKFRNIGIDPNEWNTIMKEEHTLNKEIGVLKCGIMCSNSRRSDCGGVIYHQNKGILPFTSCKTGNPHLRQGK